MKVQILVRGQVCVPTVIGARTYIPGAKAQVFQIRLINETAVQVLATCSVNRVSVADGLPEAVSIRGFLIPKYDILELDGWFINDQRLGSLIFGTPNRYCRRVRPDALDVRPLPLYNEINVRFLRGVAERVSDGIAVFRGGAKINPMASMTLHYAEAGKIARLLRHQEHLLRRQQQQAVLA